MHNLKPASRQRPVAHLLTGLVLACLLPGFVAVAVFLLLEFQQERQRLDEDAVQIAHALSVAMDTRLLHARALAQTLATSDALKKADIDHFSRDATQLMATSLEMPDATLSLFRPDGSLLARVLPAARQRSQGDSVAAVTPPVGNSVGSFRLVVAATPGNSVVSVQLPVIHDGTVIYFLVLQIPTAQLSRMLAAWHLPAGWLAGVLDTDGIIAGRNLDADNHIGKPASDTLRRALSRRDEGSVATINQQGVPFLTAFSRSRQTGYATVVGVPKSQVFGPLWRQLGYLGAAAGALFVAGLLLARSMSRQISDSMQALIAPATALGQGTPVVIGAVHMSEAAEVGAAIERAAALLQQRDLALRAQQDELLQFKFFSEHANEMLLLLDQQGNIRYANRMAAERLGYDNAELLSMTLFQIDLPATPERLDAVFMQCRHAQPPAFERVYRCKNGAQIAVEITATVLEHKGEWLMHVAPRDISERLRAEQSVRWAATHDLLTGLANRKSVLEYLERALEDMRAGKAGGAVLFVDLDRFKPVNDLYGHETGDRVLQEVARRLQACIPQEHLLARQGGDEFVAILPELAGSPAIVAEIADRILQAVSRPISLGNIEVVLSASIGISRFPEHGETAGVLMHAADLAMLQAKNSGHAAHAVYCAEMDERVQFSLGVERRLQQALDQGGLLLHYQPIINLASGRVEGVEALLRLDDGAMPLIGPATFIPIAESCGLILPLGQWVSQEACRQQVRWHADGLPLTVSVNVSAVQFGRAGFSDRVRDLIKQSGIDPQHLVIELTETAILERLDEAVETLRELKRLGVRIALDDFGTGYSSLSSLSILPLDKIKIDQSFVRRIESDHVSRAVIDAVIALARSMDLELVAEGIETEAALRYLQERGCHQGQGYYFSRPLPQADLEAWYREHLLPAPP